MSLDKRPLDKGTDEGIPSIPGLGEKEVKNLTTVMVEGNPRLKVEFENELPE